MTGRPLCGEIWAPLIRMPLVASTMHCLDAGSFAMVDKLTTVRSSNAVNRIGRASSSELVDLERLVMVFLGLAD